jgi:hypothetical protein
VISQNDGAAGNQTLGASAQPAPARNDALGSMLRLGLFVMLFALVWITVEPFTDLSDPALLNASESGNILNQLTFSLLGIVLIGHAWHANQAIFDVFARQIYCVALGWLCLTVVWSHDPLLSARRLVYSDRHRLGGAATVVTPHSAGIR